jgi:Zn-dependent metalloprotease
VQPQIHKRKCLLFVLVFALLSGSNMIAACNKLEQQQAIDALGAQIKVEMNRFQIPSHIKGDLGPRTSIDPVESAIALMKSRRDIFCASTNDDFAYAGRMQKDAKRGEVHVRVKQKYHQFDVVGPELIVHMTDSNVVGIDGKFVPDIDLPTEPVYTSQDASRVVLEYIAASGGDSTNIIAIKPLVVFVDNSDVPYLAYPVQVSFRDQGKPNKEEIFVDALKGTVVGIHPQVPGAPLKPSFGLSGIVPK